MTRKLLTIGGHSSRIWALAWSPDGENIVSLDHDGALKVRNSHTGRQIWEGTVARGRPGPKKQRRRTGSVPTVSWHPDGSLIAVTTFGPGTIWDAASGELLASAGGGALGQATGGARFAGDGTSLVSWSDAGGARIWDVDFRSVRGVELAGTQTTGGTHFAPSGRRLVSYGIGC
ncbi:MAG: WD40 repeat domain-containing protein, partial [bacterium]|nr:WD40 repeat domain-containing protein [bacterium]